MRLYLFPMAAVTNCQKFSGLNGPKFIILQCWGLEVHNGSHWVEVSRVDILRYSESARLSSLLEAPGENLFLGIFQLLESSHILRPMVSFPILKLATLSQVLLMLLSL